MTIRTGATPEVLNTECSVVNLIIIFIVICLAENYIWGRLLVNIVFISKILNYVFGLLGTLKSRIIPITKP